MLHFDQLSPECAFCFISLETKSTTPEYSVGQEPKPDTNGEIALQIDEIEKNHHMKDRDIEITKRKKESIPTTNIFYCSCSLSMCTNHYLYHLYSITGTKYRFSDIPSTMDIHKYITIYNIDKLLYVYGTDITDTDMSTIYNGVYSYSIYNTHCTHIGTPKDIVIDSSKCSECDISTNTYICLECSKVFCGRVQYGVEGNSHGVDHYTATNHSVFIKIQSIIPEKNKCSAYCYQCDNFINNNVYKYIKHIDKKIISDNHTLDIRDPINTTNNTSDKYIQISATGGIIDIGNICYITSVLQLISYTIPALYNTDNNDTIYNKRSIYSIDIDPLGECNGISPRLCMICQLRKVLARLHSTHKYNYDTSVDIKCFIDLVSQVLPRYTIGIQQDAVEFLSDLISTVQAYGEAFKYNDTYIHHSNILQLFNSYKVTYTSVIICSQCKVFTQECKEEYNIIYSSKEAKNAFDKETLDVKCSCGTQKQRVLKDIHLNTILMISHLKDTPIEYRIRFKLRNRILSYILIGSIVHCGTGITGHYNIQVNKNLNAQTKKITQPIYTTHNNEELGTDVLNSANSVLLVYRLESEDSSLVIDSSINNEYSSNTNTPISDVIELESNLDEYTRNSS
ncbi:ubiquitin carboxyl-terminal hydrolase 5/13 [Nematocida sp. AWRm80]|nr:ubiquitin carboxyl-terminal hydrolase 5/13 [Nematocida sp. AWRm80]